MPLKMYIMNCGNRLSGVDCLVRLPLSFVLKGHLWSSSLVRLTLVEPHSRFGGQISWNLSRLVPETGRRF